MPAAEIITIGTEILLGEIVDTNTRHIAHTLRDLGIDLYRTSTIGDNLERIAGAIRESMQRADIVVTTGGLGPTVDDPTREAVAQAVGIELEFRDELWQQVKSVIARYGRKPTENQKRQAYIPKGSIVIPNPVGTAPAFIVETARNVIISLPGVPREMELLLHESVVPYLGTKYSSKQVIKVRLLHTAGQGEGAIDDRIGDLEKLSNPTVGLAAHNGVVDIRLTAKAENETVAGQMIAELEADIRSRLGETIFGVDDDTLEKTTIAAVTARGWTLTIAGFGLTDSIQRRLPQITPLVDLQPGMFDQAVKQLQMRTETSAALGVGAFVDEMAIEITIRTPKHELTKRFTYGGHPRNLANWAMNVGLNMLRLEAQATE
jgi:competence/damage-inducible protein CinA-like protein